jgi:hypothetical protein
MEEVFKVGTAVKVTYGSWPFERGTICRVIEAAGHNYRIKENMKDVIASVYKEHVKEVTSESLSVGDIIAGMPIMAERNVNGVEYYIGFKWVPASELVCLGYFPLEQRGRSSGLKPGDLDYTSCETPKQGRTMKPLEKVELFTKSILQWSIKGQPGINIFNTKIGRYDAEITSEVRYVGVDYVVYYGNDLIGRLNAPDAKTAKSEVEKIILRHMSRKKIYKIKEQE